MKSDLPAVSLSHSFAFRPSKHRTGPQHISNRPSARASTAKLKVGTGEFEISGERDALWRPPQGMVADGVVGLSRSVKSVKSVIFLLSLRAYALWKLLIFKVSNMLHFS